MTRRIKQWFRRLLHEQYLTWTHPMFCQHAWKEMGRRKLHLAFFGGACNAEGVEIWKRCQKCGKDQITEYCTRGILD